MYMGNARRLGFVTATDLYKKQQAAKMQQASVKAAQSAKTPAGSVQTGMQTIPVATGDGRYTLQNVPTYAPAPAPAPAPVITVSPTINTAVSPNLQQTFTPQVSPVFQQSSGSGSQDAGTTQNAPGGQSGTGGGAGGGLTSNDLLSILNAQAEQARLQREADRAEAAARDQQAQAMRAQELQLQQQQYAQQQAAQEKAQQEYAAAQQAQALRDQQAAQSAAVHSQYTGPDSAPVAVSNAPTPLTTARKPDYVLPIAGVVAVVAVGTYLIHAKKGRKK